jgi:hypothetical protein
MIGMRRCPIIFVLAAAVTCVEVKAQPARPHGLLNDYYPAYCHPIVYPAPSCSLVIFREGKLQTSVELPIQPDFFGYARGGTVLYALPLMKKPVCLYRIELNPVGATSLTCPPGLVGAVGLTVSATGDLLLVSGQFNEGGSTRCGVFEIRVPDGPTRQVLNAQDCGSYRKSPWISLSLSPDAAEAVAVRQDRLEMFRLANGTSEAVAEGIVKAAWSPDGRWIAALDVHGRTELIDPSNFKKQRTLAGSEVQWSPDSRYLLRVKACFFPIASNGVGTVQALDVATGKSITIESSRCEVETNSTGWVNSKIAQ